MSEWKVSFDSKQWLNYVDLYFYRKRGNGSEVMTWDSNGNQILHYVGEGEIMPNIKPTLRLNAIDSNSLLKSLAEAIHDQGVSTDNDARMRGLLEATKEHLSDMRKLVFKP